MEIVPHGNRIWKTTFIDPTALINGNLMLDGDFIYIAPFVETYSDEGDIRIGEGVNIQDGVILYGPVEMGSSISLAHRCEIKNSTIGSFSFVSFGAKISNSRIGDGTFISPGAVLDGVDLPPDSFVPPCGRNALGTIMEEAKILRETALKTNSELVIGYIDLLYSIGERAVLYIAPSPKTSWNKNSIFPRAEGARLLGQTRIIGGVEIEGKVEIGSKTSIRGDEGRPIKIGNHSRIGNNVVFHSLLGKKIEVGSNVAIADGSVIHGPITIGNGATIGKNCILFNSVVKNNAIIPDGTVMLDNKIWSL